MLAAVLVAPSRSFIMKLSQPLMAPTPAAPINQGPAMPRGRQPDHDVQRARYGPLGAASDGFGGVSIYDFAAADIRARLQGNEHDASAFNAPPGDWAAGERGIASLPGP